ncbi:hypothetical protein HanRHA438_Chr06g0278471 [Helianthus annuus]|nr:hypothetical protein HanRHA438_Chr06g0278471 [Helianthus annuus]
MFPTSTNNISTSTSSNIRKSQIHELVGYVKVCSNLPIILVDLSIFVNKMGFSKALFLKEVYLYNF